MIGTIKRPLKHAQWLGSPAAVPSTTAAAYLDALHSVAQKGKRDAISRDEVSLHVFERWLEISYTPDAELVVNEELISRLESDMKEGTFKSRNGTPFRSLGRQVAANIRDLHDQAFRAHHALIVRPLVDNRTLPRYQRFLQLTAVTQKAMAWFEDAGVRAGKAGAPGTSLTVATRILAISEAFWLLSRLNVDSLERITPEMVAGTIPTTGVEDPGYRRVIRAINGVGTLFRCCVAKGLLTSDPTTEIAHNKFNNYAERDFLPPEELEKIRDITTLDRGNDQHVVDRLVLLLFADTALRRGELASLGTSQVIKRDGGFTIRLLPGNQKMANKVAVDLHVLYPETAVLLDQYITKVRPRLAKPNTIGFLVDGRGRTASAIALAAASAREGERLGLRTYYGHGIPSPHDLRRTFAMCNASPLGLSLQPHELAERLRDGIEVVFKHYCTSNPIINAQRATVYRKRAGGVVDEDKAQEILQTLKSCRVDAKLIRRVERSLLEQRVAAAPAKSAVPSDNQAVEWIDEEDAYLFLKASWGERPYWRKFRDVMRTKGALRRADRFGKVSFDAAAIRAMAEAYTPLSMIQNRMQVDQGCLEGVLRAADVVRIGRLVLLPQERTLALMRGGPDRASSPSDNCRAKHPPRFRAKHRTDPRLGAEEKVA